MHRSGTSALTRLINILGISLGRNLFKGNSDVNAKGFWENKELIDIHDRILGQLNSSWLDARELPDQWWQKRELDPYADRIVAILERDFEDQPMFALKDPRLCRLLPFWLNILKNRGVLASCILAIRSPAEVSKSLARRDRFDGGTSSYLWLTYVLESEFYSRNLPRTMVCYDELLANWSRTAGKIAKELDFQWPLALNEVEEVVNQELLPELRHHKATEIDPNNPDELSKKADEVYSKLISSDLKDAMDYFDETRNWLGRPSPLAKSLADSLYRTNMLLREETRNLAKARKEHAEAMQHINRIRSHWVWKIARSIFRIGRR